MPELPEVETIVRELAAVENHTVEKATIFWPNLVSPLAKEFTQQIANQKIEQIMRRGKWIVLKLSRSFLYIHLRMTGKLLFTLPDSYKNYERARLALDGRTLHFVDQRKFGRWVLTQDSHFLKNLGAEPLSSSFTAKVLIDLIRDRKGVVKSFLLDQHFIAGLGNIYVDEVLWASQIHPKERVEHLCSKQIEKMHSAIVEILKKAVDKRGTSFGAHSGNYASTSGASGEYLSHLQVFRKEKNPCPRCSSLIEKMIVAQRGTHFCPLCQPLNPFAKGAQ